MQQLATSQTSAMPACTVLFTLCRCSHANRPVNQDDTWTWQWHLESAYDSCSLIQCPAALWVAYLLACDSQLLADSDLSLLAGWKQVLLPLPGHLLPAPLHPTQQSTVLHVSVPMWDRPAVGDFLMASDGYE